MTLLSATILSLALLGTFRVPADQEKAASSADSQTVKVTRAGSQPSAKGPAENFTGSVRVDYLFQAEEPSRVSGALVTFEPGARTAWHVHPLGQRLIVTAGAGWVQQWGGAVQAIRPGETHS